MKYLVTPVGRLTRGINGYDWSHPEEFMAIKPVLARFAMLYTDLNRPVVVE